MDGGVRSFLLWTLMHWGMGGGRQSETILPILFVWLLLGFLLLCVATASHVHSRALAELFSFLDSCLVFLLKDRAWDPLLHHICHSFLVGLFSNC